MGSPDGSTWEAGTCHSCAGPPSQDHSCTGFPLPVRPPVSSKHLPPIPVIGPVGAAAVTDVAICRAVIAGCTVPRGTNAIALAIAITATAVRTSTIMAALLCRFTIFITFSLIRPFSFLRPGTGRPLLVAHQLSIRGRIIGNGITVLVTFHLFRAAHKLDCETFRTS